MSQYKDFKEIQDLDHKFEQLCSFGIEWNTEVTIRFDLKFRTFAKH